MQPQFVSKGKFAEIIGVTPGRVSQMLADGTIDGTALSGEGRMAKINVALAASQISSRRDVGQALGNGLSTRLDVARGAETEQSSADDDDEDLLVRPLRRDSVEDEIKRERLAREKRINRQAEEDDALRRGALMDTAQVRSEMARIASTMMVTFEGALPDFASAISSKFEIPQRDVLHELRLVFVEMRKSASQRETRRTASLPEHVEVEIEVAQDS